MAFNYKWIKDSGSDYGVWRGGGAELIEGIAHIVTQDQWALYTLFPLKALCRQIMRKD